MTNRYFHPDRGRAAGVDQLFTAIARRYDLVNDFQSLGLHRLWKRRAVRLAGLTKDGLALDVCSGTGDLAIRAGLSGARVVAVDFNEAMLLQGMRRHSRRDGRVGNGSAGAPVWIRADALRLPFGEATFDAATIGYGLRNLSDLAGGVREMLRVIKPGGRLVALDFGVPENALWKRVYFAYLGWMVPLLGTLLCGDSQAYSYILRSLKVYPGQKGVYRVMRDCGAVGLKVESLLGGAMAINACVRPDAVLSRETPP